MDWTALHAMDYKSKWQAGTVRLAASDRFSTIQEKHHAPTSRGDPASLRR
jgi:hypothetical protein